MADVHGNNARRMMLLDAALSYLEYQMELVYQNEAQEEYISPFGNNGTSFVCPVFEVHSYDWGWDDSEPGTPQPVNFKWGDVEITWYKYMGRGMRSVKATIDAEVIMEMLYDCVSYITSHGMGYSPERTQEDD